MSSVFKRIIENVATRIMFIIYISIILITGFFIIFGYYSQLNLQELRQYDRLEAIVATVATQIDGDEHEKMMEDHLFEDDIMSNDENFTYHHLQTQLDNAATVNKLKKPIYTMVYNEDSSFFQFGVTSDPEPYFRHSYVNYPQILLDSIDVGSSIPSYESENGEWLSAFYPIKNSQGETVAIIEADVEFTGFINEVQREYLNETLIALGVIILMALVLIPYTRKILKEEELRMEQARLQAAIIREKNRDITDSINYALKIQSAILPPLSEFDNLLPESFVFFKPKDIVAGDFYFLEEFEGHVYVAVADCTGHGVPGAMVSVICSNALSHAVHHSNITDPGKILDAVTDIVVEKFKSSPDGIKDGMDICLCKINVETRVVEYSGANNALYIIKADDEFISIKPCKQPIGQFDYRKSFVTHTFNLDKKDSIYLFTDGFADQFGGANGKKLKYKPFKNELISSNDKPLADQLAILDKFFEDWKGEYEQVDDVCVIGIRF
jgi:serine phosphatase RsbU (regulator of sigma subunit)